MNIEEANRRVADSERLVAGWRDLVDRMQADGSDRPSCATFYGHSRTG
jgi:hypothetical protein